VPKRYKKLKQIEILRPLQIILLEKSAKGIQTADFLSRQTANYFYQDSVDYSSVFPSIPGQDH